MIRGINLKYISVCLMLIFIFQIAFPTLSYALTGGPSQPEVSSFEPIGTTQMVDLYSGDFNYNIPLLNVPGSNGSYPINIAYHAGIGMEQEASWVGLGWNINPGAIVRQMRGLPDDFDGDEVKKEYSIKKDYTVTAGLGAPIEIFGLNLGKTLSNSKFNLGVYYNSYRGVGHSVGVNFSELASRTIKNKDGKSLVGKAGLGLNFDSQGGLSAQPSLSMFKVEGETRRGFTIGSTLTSLQGLNEINGKFEKQFLTQKNQWATDYQPGTGVSLTGAGYIPGIQSSMASNSYYGGFSFGTENTPVYKKLRYNFSYTETKVVNTDKVVKAYGLLNLENADGDDVIKDFNREKDGEISKNSPYTPMPVRTNDIYSIQGQGTGGAFRAFRSDIGHLTDPRVTSNENKLSVNLEAGAGTGIELGADPSYGFSQSYSGPWKRSNNAVSQIDRYYSDGKDVNNPKYEAFYFKSNGEMTSSSTNEMDRIGGDDPVAYDLGLHWEWFGVKPKVKNSYNGNHANFSNRKEREKRNQSIEYFTKNELDNLGYSTSSDAKPHHIHQMSVTNPDGNKYIYGLPVYNNIQRDVSFSVLSPDNSFSDAYQLNPKLVHYSPQDASVNNDRGQENYYSSTELPGYAHSYMLTSIQSQDYVDLTGNGVSDDDFGYWTKFSYDSVENYKWRVPYEEDSANYMKGNYSNLYDDKGSYTYGEKTLEYLEKIETNTHFAVFELGDRSDGIAVVGENGGIGTVKQKYLKSITLYSKADPSNPIKKVHFEYDYSLCKGIPSNDNSTDGYITTNQGGKLTLKKIYFTHLGNTKGKLTPYIFDYDESNSDSNPNYSELMVDRWGNYQPSQTGYQNNSESPYTRQDYFSERDKHASAWCLREINLPSGGKITVDYEADDYLHVQDKKAMQMFEITGTSDLTKKTSDGWNLSKDRRRIYFKVNETLSSDSDVKKYIDGIEDMYFKAFMRLKGVDGNNANDYVKGYVPISKVSGTYGKSTTSNNIGFFTLDLVKYRGKKKGIFNANPFQMTGWKYMRYQRPDIFTKFESNGNISSFVGKNLKKIIKEATGLLAGYYNKCKAYNYCDKIVSGQNQLSYVRLNSNERKYGGGHRVKSIKITSGWGNEEYGQQYKYVNSNGESSGVAEYEPLTGGDEISLRKPIYYNKKNFPRPSHEDFKEAPYGESFFPGARVGYSRVIVKNLENTTHTLTYGQTGVSVNEFYTSKDFPVIVRKAKQSVLHKGYNLPIPIPMVGTQNFTNNGYSNGYTVILNDMPGKPKSVATYPYKANEVAFNEDPVSRTKYNYQTKKDYSPNKLNELDNEVTVLDNHGNSRKAVIGQTYDFYIDQAEHSSEGMRLGLEANLAIQLPLFVPTAFADFEYNQSLYRHVITNKVIYRNGVLKSVESMADGAIVTAENLIYDAETGQVLLTKSNNEFKKPVYNYSYAAHWAYDGMKGSYENYRAEFNVTNTGGGVHFVPSGINVDDLVKLGDKIALSSNSNNHGWVTEINTSNNSFTLREKDNTDKNLIASGKVIILESGNANMQSISNGNIVSLKDPTRMVNKRDLFWQVFNNIHNPAYVITHPTYSLDVDLCNGNHANRLTFFNNVITIFYSDTNGSSDSCTYSPNTDDPGYVPPSLIDPDKVVFNPNTYTMNDSVLFVTGTDGSVSGIFQFRLDDSSAENCEVCDEYPILQASAVEFCDTCWEYNYQDVGNPQADNSSGSLVYLDNSAINPYVFGKKGIWRTKKSWAYQANRKQHGSKGNGTKSNIDGEFDFRPFDWDAVLYGNKNWTWASEITLYSPYGYQLENRNPLNIYSSEMYGYGNTVVTAVGSNAKYMEIAFDGFEDYSFTNGLINHGHMSFSNGNITSVASHTGEKALLVKANTPLTYSMSANFFKPESDKKYVISAWVYTKNAQSGKIEVQVNGGSTITANVTNKFQEIDGWTKIEAEFTTPNATITSFTVKLDANSTTTDAYFDDLRISPFNGGMKTYVYKPNTLWLIAELDNLNYATFYNYDEEGSLVQIKKETNDGLKTIKQTRNNTKRQ